ncbi:MAG: sigma-70 family RNA polymerase sigma factor [Verrucomicrobiales bacterium]|nr:sigma-70 family RNA polymerase sigma factor [Verrucomicrobiales bacterium]
MENQGEQSEITRILQTFEGGDPQAAEQLLPLVYEDLRRLAAQKMARERPGQTLQPTALVHEAWLRISQQATSWENRRHFFSAAAEAMRRILIERARRRQREKHGGRLQRVAIEDLERLDVADNADDDVLLLLDEALQRLNEVDPVGAELIRLRFFTGLSNVDAARLLGLAERTAKRTWAYARTWLYAEMQRRL